MKVHQIVTKYNIGDKVWLMNDEPNIVQDEIVAVHADIIRGRATEINYTVGYENWGRYEEWKHGIGEIFSTKEDLIKTL